MTYQGKLFDIHAPSASGLTGTVVLHDVQGLEENGSIERVIRVSKVSLDDMMKVLKGQGWGTIDIAVLRQPPAEGVPARRLLLFREAAEGPMPLALDKKDADWCGLTGYGLETTKKTELFEFTPKEVLE
jgi:hypothetical protein